MKRWSRHVAWTERLKKQEEVWLKGLKKRVGKAEQAIHKNVVVMCISQE